MIHVLAALRVESAGEIAGRHDVPAGIAVETPIEAPTLTNISPDAGVTVMRLVAGRGAHFTVPHAHVVPLVVRVAGRIEIDTRGETATHTSRKLGSAEARTT